MFSADTSELCRGVPSGIKRIVRLEETFDLKSLVGILGRFDWIKQFKIHGLGPANTTEP